MSKVTITIEGEVGSGKSALLGRIAQLMAYLDIPVTYEIPEEARIERENTRDNWDSDLEMYKPSVHLVEKLKAKPLNPTAGLFVKSNKAPSINELLEKHKLQQEHEKLYKEIDDAIAMDKLKKEKEKSRKAFIDSMNKTSEIVDNWPDWKKNWRP